MRRGVTAFQHARLSLILAARGLTQTQFAALVGVSDGTISKWRSGPQTPEPAKLERLASVVNVSPEWFTRPMLPSVKMELFRSNAAALASARAMLSARIALLQDLAVLLNTYVDYPDLNVPSIRANDPNSIADEEIEAVAAECRKRWGLGSGPIPDLMLAVEGAGIIVAREMTGAARIEGLSAWSEPLLRPLILLCADKANAFRSRFDLAHEVGHIVMHRYVDPANRSTHHKLLEHQAHHFAGALLMPGETFAAGIKSHPTLDDLVLLKQRWGASVGAMVKRLQTLSLIDEDEHLAIQKRISARWGRKSEPGDGDRTPESPRLLRRTFELLVSEGVMPRSGLLQLAGLSDHDVTQLTSLPERFFQHPGEVVQMPVLKPAASTSIANSLGVSSSLGGTIVPFRAK